MGLVSAGIRGIVKARGRVKPAKDILRQAPTQQELPIIKKDISSSVPTKLDDELSNLSKTQEADESLNDLDNIINKNEGSLSHQKAKEWRSLNKVPEEENIDPVTGKKQKKRRKFQEEAKLLTDEKGEIIPERLPKFRDEGAFKKYNPNDPEDKAVRIFTKKDIENFIKNNKSILDQHESLSVGTLFNTKDGFTYIDISSVIPKSKQKQAEALGKKTQSNIYF